MEMNSFDFIVAWFAAHCDGDWEHDVGIRVATLDNPGWRVDIRIEDTELQGIEIDWKVDEQSEQEWLQWRATGRFFEARCGPKDLGRAFDAFRLFAEGDR